MRCIHALLLAVLCASCGAAEVLLRRGTLVFADGNRVTGRLTGEGRFTSDRFGEIRFQEAEARFEPATDAPDDDTPGSLKERVEAEINPRPPPGPAPAARPTPPRWHPWKLSLSGFADRTSDDGQRRHEYYGGIKAERPSPSDPIVLDARYEYRRTGERLDRRRATATLDWRHRFPDSRWFTLYRPYLEYDGRTLKPEDAATLGRSRLNYLFTQQQAGVGYHLLQSDRLKSNAVLSWNHFHVWVFDVDNLGRGVPSVRLENSLALGRGLELKQTGLIYWLYESDTEEFLWENSIDLTQHLGRHLFLTLRHEYRRDHPLRDATPLDRLRLLFGITF